MAVKIQRERRRIGKMSLSKKLKNAAAAQDDSRRMDRCQKDSGGETSQRTGIRP